MPPWRLTEQSMTPRENSKSTNTNKHTHAHTHSHTHTHTHTQKRTHAVSKSISLLSVVCWVRWLDTLERTAWIRFQWCYVVDTQLYKVGSISELMYFHKLQNIIQGNYDKQGVLLVYVTKLLTLALRVSYSLYENELSIHN